MLLAGESIANLPPDDNDEGEDEEEPNNQDEQINTEQTLQQKKEEQKLKRSVGNLNLEECKFLEEITDSSELYKFDMNKVLDSDDEYNTVKRKARTKPMLAIVRPWQNKIMADFLEMLFKEAGDAVLTR